MPRPETLSAGCSRHSPGVDGSKALLIPTDDDWKEGWQEYERGRPGDPGIVDCISFAVMRRLGLAEAFTNDQHVTAAGFTTLF
jgi:predicted nucleic acid-binding protein